MPGGVPAAAVSEACDVADENLIRSKGCPLGHRLGGLVISATNVIPLRRQPFDGGHQENHDHRSVASQ